MSRSLGPALPADLVDLLCQRDVARLLGRALPVVTVDAGGAPHPMLSSYLELRATGRRTISIVVGARSRSAANLEARRVATVLIVDEDRTVYIKCRAGRGPVQRGELARFDLAVEDVLEDRAASWEAGLRITGGITCGPAPDLGGSAARAVLELLGLDLPATGS